MSRSRSRAISGAKARSAPGPTYALSSSAPRSSAAANPRGPSTTNACSARRARGSRMRSRSRRTRWCRGPSAGTGSSGRLQRLASDRDQRAERSRVVHREVGENLAVDVDAGGLQPRHEARVRDVVLPAPGVDPDDPEPPELTLARPPVAVRVPKRAHDLLVGLPEPAALCAGVARGLLEHGVAGLLPLGRTLYTRHPGRLPSGRRPGRPPSGSGPSERRPACRPRPGTPPPPPLR